MFTSRDTGSCTIEKLDTENMGIAVEILLLCALEFEICLGGGKKYPQLPANVAKKPLPGQGLMGTLATLQSNGPLCSNKVTDWYTGR